jgi:hypothetical protein
VKRNGIVIAFPGPSRTLGAGELPTRLVLSRAWRDGKLSSAWIGPFNGTTAGVLGATLISLDPNRDAWRIQGLDRDFYVQFNANEAWDVLRALSEISAAKPKTTRHAVHAIDTILYAAGLSGRKP